MSKKEIQIPVGLDQTIVLTRFGREDSNHFSIWLCQGTYDEEKDEWNTQFHISDFELKFWITKLQEIDNTREKIKEELFGKSILEKLSEEIDSFTATKGKSPSRIYVCAKALDLLSLEVAAEITVYEGDIKSLKKQDKPLDLHIFGLKVYRRFDEVSEEQLFVLE